MSDVGILGNCPCGGGPTAPDYTCERCRMVYALLLARDVRAAQTDYFHDRNTMNLNAAKQLERKFDTVLAKLLVPPVAQQPELDMQLDTTADYYAAGG